MTFRIFYYLLIAIILPNVLLGQSYSDNKKALNAYKNAEIHLNKHQKKEAINALKLAIEIDSTFVVATQQLADLYRSEKLYREAIPLYYKVLNINPNLTPLTYFGLGEALLTQGQYKSALYYLTHYSQGKLTEKGRVLTNKYITDCEFSLKQDYNNILKVDKLPTSINTNDNEYFPKLTVGNNKIIFTRKTNNLENFYESSYKDNSWSNATKLIGVINSELYNEGAHCISLDGKYLYFTACNRPDSFGSCDIYVSKLENGSWQEPKNLGKSINSKYWDSQPSISADGRTLFFTSNRPGGQGGYDIWKSELLENGNWGPPTNLGENINTSFDEGAPFIHADNTTLYFASNGWPGFGQQDLFLSKKNENKEWSTPINLGYPINNSYIQNSIQVTVDGKYAFISSQDVNDQLDIYQFSTPEIIKPNNISYLHGYVLDKNTNQALLANITVTNTKNNEIVFKTQTEENDGSFLITIPTGIDYAFHIQKNGYLFFSDSYTLDNKQIPDKKIIYLNPIQTGQSTQLNNIFFDTDKYDLLATSYLELGILATFLKTNPSIKIQIAGHTDNTGLSDKNLTLSKKRASAVKDYLITLGISSNRLNTIGHGDKAPIADNENAEGRRLNRRTEIIIDF